MIRSAGPDDADRLCEIYNHYVLTSIATFEEEPVSADDMRQRVADVQKHFFWLVYEDDRGVAAYAYAGKWKARAAYRHSVELSVYVSPERQGLGIGRQLYAELLRRLRERNVRSVVGGVAGDNAASIGLHRSFGFEQVARFRDVGHKFGQWVDVTYFQLLLPATRSLR
jgi:phosphinothricin acetyltransferase